MQACALNPRCIMNSWKDDGRVNTPWLHPEATGLIRAAIELRLSLLPYLYTSLHESVAHARPVHPPRRLARGAESAGHPRGRGSPCL